MNLSCPTSEAPRTPIPTVDVQFTVVGKLIPVDHGYRLFSAISEFIPKLHHHDRVGVHPISGQLAGDRLLAITRRSCLTIRLPADQIGLILPLAGRLLKVGEHEIRVGIPMTRPLMPSARLYCRLVVIKGFMEPEPFLEAARRQLQQLGIRGNPYLVMQRYLVGANAGSQSGTHSPYLRRTIRIHEKEVVGFALRVEELDDGESMFLQEKGVGGRRRFGCGIFLPWPR